MRGSGFEAARKCRPFSTATESRALNPESRMPDDVPGPARQNYVTLRMFGPPGLRHFGPMKLTTTEQLLAADGATPGGSVGSAIAHVGRAALLAVAIVRALPAPQAWGRPALGELHRQVVNALPLVLLLSAMGGALMAQQTGVQFHRNLPDWVIGAIIAASLITEMVPLFIGFALVGMVGARIAAELATMQVTEQIDALEVVGRDPVIFLVVPRVTAGIAAGAVLTSFGLAVSLLTGWITAVAVTPVTTTEFWYGVRNYMRDFPLFFALIKCSAFGLAIAFLGSYVGLDARDGSVGVGRAVTRAVVLMIAAIVVLDTLLVPLLKLL